MADQYLNAGDFPYHFTPWPVDNSSPDFLGPTDSFAGATIDPLLTYSSSFAPAHLLGASLIAGEVADFENANPSGLTPSGPPRYHCDLHGCQNNRGQGFIRPSDLKRHQDKHTKRFPCPECRNRFGSKTDMERHGKEVHGKPDENGNRAMHFCPEKSCKRSKRGFPRYWNMKIHYDKLHGGPLPSAVGSPAISSMDTPSTSSGESAAGSPPSSPEDMGMAFQDLAIFNYSNDPVMRDHMRSRYEELKAKQAAGLRELQSLKAILRTSNAPTM